MEFICNLYNSLKSQYSVKKVFKKQLADNSDWNVRFFNWWGDDLCDTWLNRFIRSRRLVYNDEIINIISVFGDRKICNCISDGPVIFYTGENIHYSSNIQYSDYLLQNENVKLALGFDYFEDERYIRFPLWMQYMFLPESSHEEIISRCAELRYPIVENRKKCASLIARFDWDGNRTKIHDSLKSIMDISCPSTVLHNDNSLKSIFKDNKKEYLRQFWFNICPENSNSYGYVTEKVFEAIESGCIPIYWGSCNKPEEDILNHDAIILWDMNGNNTDNINLIQDLISNPKRRQEFSNQPRLKDNAEEKIISTFESLEAHIRNLI